MQDVFALGNVAYVAAEPVKKKNVLENTPNWLTSIYHLIISPQKKSVKGQTVLITGGGNGIGKALALRLAQEGCNIVIADIEWAAAKETVKALIAKNVIAKAYHVDVADEEQLKKLKIEIEKDIAPVDILINNAGIMPLLSLREGTENEIERIVKITRVFLPGMISRKQGHIVGVASITALHPMPGAIIYSSTKFAVHGFIKTLYEELRHEGKDFIKLTSVLPYFISTRKDVMEAVNLRFPCISAEETADIAVDAILRNELTVTIPKYNFWIIKLTNLLSVSNQNLIRDHVLKEKETRKMFYEEK